MADIADIANLSDNIEIANSNNVQASTVAI
jgi:hypothetical protein